MMGQPAVLFVALLVLGLSAAACGSDGLRSEVVVDDAAFPSALAFAPDGRLFYTELRSGDIRVVSADGGLLPEPFAHVSVAAKGEWGLLGLALDPGFPENHYLYVYFMRPAANAVVCGIRSRPDGSGRCCLINTS